MLSLLRDELIKSKAVQEMDAARIERHRLNQAPLYVTPIESHKRSHQQEIVHDVRVLVNPDLSMLTLSNS